MSRWDYYGYYPPSQPKAAKGGIKAQSQRGAFGKSWWAKRWIQVLESFNMGARLGRGRSYARSGQVLSIDITKGKVDAQVQGSRSKPYHVTIQVQIIALTDWQKLVGELAHQVIFAAKLLAGEMPQDIEQAFSAVKLSLFPATRKDLGTACSCPDPANPCKHIAAVYYLLGEEFDRDPFLIFQMRGLGRQELTDLLGGSMVKAPRPSTSEALLPVEPLPSDGTAFWETAPLPDDFLGEVRIPPVPTALPRRLGKFPFWRGREHFLETLGHIYEQASPRGMAVFLGESNI